MPYSVADNRSILHVQCSRSLPSLIWKARQRTNDPSNSAYIRRVICEAVSRDLSISLTDLIAAQPPVRSGEQNTLNPTPIEDVR